MMTFLAGGHACIGFKFAQLEEKVVLSLLLESFVFFPGGEQRHCLELRRYSDTDREGRTA